MEGGDVHDPLRAKVCAPTPQSTPVTRPPTLRRRTRHSPLHAHAVCYAGLARPPPNCLRTCPALTTPPPPFHGALHRQVFDDDDNDDVTSPGGLAASPVRSKATAATAADLTNPGPAAATLEATPLVRVCLSTLWR